MNKIKLLLATSSILALSTIVSINVNAIDNADKIPKMTLSQVNNIAQINWATEMLDTDLIWKTGFEDGDYKPSYLPASCNTLDSSEYYSGYYSARVKDSALAGVGNFKYPAQENWTSRMVYNNIFGLQPGMKFSASVKIKNTGDTSSISLIPESSSLTKYTRPFHQVYGIAQPIIVGADTNGSSFIPIENFDYFNEQMAKKGNFVVFVANKVGANYDASYAHIYPANIDTVNKGIKFGSPTYYKKGEELQYVFLCYPLSLGSRSISGNNEWTSFNFNGTMQDLGDNYDIANKGLKLIFETKNTGSLYIDDFKLGHATKVRLYRDNNLIYEGYESQLNDANAKDIASPNKITNIKSSMSMVNEIRNLTITFDNPQDNGSTYNYTIKAMANTGESPLSQAQSITIKSDIKGYSYIIDKNSSTVPDDVIDTTSTTIAKNITDSGVYYLHIKAIDNAGNSSIVHQKIDIPTITAKANAKDDLIRLDWTMGDVNNKTFKVYQKKPGSTEYQSISATNFDKPVKILLAYPEQTCSLTPQPTTTYVDNKGQTVTIPISASIKKWMEEPKPNYPKGYGMGLIEIDVVGLSQYDANPNAYLKDSNGEYKYDVFALGIADCNGYQTITTQTGSAIGEFIESGRGVFFGHDTVYSDKRQTIADVAKKYMNMTVSSGNSYRDTVVRITKKGLLTNFPHNIGEVGDTLNIPQAHTSNQVPNSLNDNWLIFNNGIDTDVRNFYLTTYNNMAMSQTGHSTGQATEDEQKILANALFYLNQLSSDNFLDDYSGQDVNAPNMPRFYEHNFTEDGYINLNFNSVEDNGSTYEYYVQAEDKNGSSLTLSNIVTETITSGVKGYSYVVDSSPSTIPDNETEQSTDETIKIKTNNSGELYVHIKAIDNVGNASETYHYKVTDITKPTLTLSLAPNTWTNNTVTINATASDSGSGIKYITLPNGNIVKSTKATYTVIQNGVYYFKTVDYMGNETISSINVSNIDKKNPTVTITNNQNWTNQDVQVNITATDD